MASAKRKQDDKHLATLRGLVKLDHNKQCFDCNQRGPTYVNMTIGSFVCTGCSGLLRGLNPPHRVKSISMASFTNEEIEFVKSRGNDYCKKVWLSHYDASQNKFDGDLKDDNKVREMMCVKYEKKRYYMAPTEAMLEEAKVQNNVPKTEAQTKPLRSLGNIPNLQLQTIQVSRAPPPTSTPSLPLPSPVATQPAPTGSLDLLADIGADPFASAPRPVQPSGGFADFAQFHNVASAPAAHNAPVQHNIPASNSSSHSDRYSAFADLDSVFGGTAQTNVAWPSLAWSGQSAAPVTSAPTANPFLSTSSNTMFNGGHAAPAPGAWALPGMTAPVSLKQSSSSAATHPTTSHASNTQPSFATSFPQSTSQTAFTQGGFTAQTNHVHTQGTFGHTQNVFGQPQGAFGQPGTFGQQPGAFGQQPSAFGQQPSAFGQQPGGFGQTENAFVGPGGFSQPAGQAFVSQPQGQGFGQPAATFGQQGVYGPAVPGYSYQTPTAVQGFGGYGQQQQQGWAGAAPANPFLNVASQQQQSPRTVNSTNPFL